MTTATTTTCGPDDVTPERDRQYPVTETGILQALEALERNMREIRREKREACRTWNQDLALLDESIAGYLNQLDALRGGELLPFDDEE